MPFDITTARPIKTGGFDISTAKPFEEEVTPEKTNSIADILKIALGIGTGVAGGYGAIKGSKKIISIPSEYPYRKTLAIREGLKKSQKAESKLYGKGLKTISKTSTETISPVGSIEKMEEVLRNKGIIDKAGNKIGIPSNTIEAQYLKSRDILMNKFSNSEGGKIKVGDIIQESRNIKAKGGKFGTPKSVEASQLSDSLIAGIKSEVKSPEFKAMQTRYGKHREVMKPLEETFKPYENVYKTGKGEKVLTDIYSQPVGTRKALQNIRAKTGQSIKGAKAMSVLKQANPLNILRNKKFLGVLNIAPIMLDALKYSKDPMQYIAEQEGLGELRKKYQAGTMTEAEKIKAGLLL